MSWRAPIRQSVDGCRVPTMIMHQPSAIYNRAEAAMSEKRAPDVVTKGFHVASLVSKLSFEGLRASLQFDDATGKNRARQRRHTVPLCALHC